MVIDVAHRGAHGMVVLTGTDFQVGDNRTIINLARAYGVRALGPVPNSLSTAARRNSEVRQPGRNTGSSVVKTVPMRQASRPERGSPANTGDTPAQQSAELRGGESL